VSQDERLHGQSTEQEEDDHGQREIDGRQEMKIHRDKDGATPSPPVSRGDTTVYGNFGGPQQFSLKLKPRGDEVRFELQVGAYSLGRDL
jgi:hypothetical protein